MIYTHIYRWGNNPVRAARKGQRCRIVARGAMRSVLVEFDDGHRMVTSNRAVKPAYRRSSKVYEHRRQVMDARELAERMVNILTDEEIRSLLYHKSARSLATGIELSMAIHRERGYKIDFFSNDVIREIESLMGV